MMDRKAGYPGKVVFAWNYLSWGGAQMFLLGIARRIKSHCEILFLLPQGTSKEFIRYLEADGLNYEFLQYSVPTEPTTGLVAKLRSHVAKIKSEQEIVTRVGASGAAIAHVDLGPWQSLLALTLLAWRRPTFYTIHNRLEPPPLVRSLIWKLKFLIAGFQSNLHAIASNRDAREALTSVGAGSLLDSTIVACTNVNPDEINGVRLDPDARRKVRARLGVGDDDLLLLTLAQFIDRKGRWVLVDAARELAVSGRNLKFRWLTSTQVGEDDLTRLNSLLGSADFSVIQMSELNLNRQSLLETVAGADIFVLPSSVEGLPIALMEAMALGLPVIATSVNAIPEAVTHLRNGFLVQPGDSNELVKAIKLLVDDKELRLRMGGAAKEILQSDLTEPTVAKTVLAAYTEALKQ